MSTNSDKVRDNPANNVENYGWNSADGALSCGYIAPAIIELAKSLRAKRIADLGSGNGALCADLSRNGFEVVGIEKDKEGCDLAGRTHPSIPFYNFGLEDDPRELLAVERKFDLVVSTEVIEHLYAPHLLPSYAKAVLNPGGHLIVSTPYHGYIKNLALSIMNKWDGHHSPLWHGGHIKFWSRRTLTALLTTAGFDVIGFHGVGRLPLMWKSMVLVSRCA